MKEHVLYLYIHCRLRLVCSIPHSKSPVRPPSLLTELNTRYIEHIFSVVWPSSATRFFLSHTLPSFLFPSLSPFLHATLSFLPPSLPLSLPPFSQVTVALIDLTPELHYVSVPRLSPYSFLQASATNSSKYALLAGPANIFLDNNFVAKVCTCRATLYTWCINKIIII